MRGSVGSAAVEASVPNDGAAVVEAAHTWRGGREALHLDRDSQGFGGHGFKPGQQRSYIALAQSATLNPRQSG
jgi:hypothetical protein